ncbi:MAG: EAL domain-containing protein [Neptuniibacter sp.]
MVINNSLFSGRSLSTARVFLTLAFLPLLLVALSGIYIYLDLSNQAQNEARSHTQNSAKLLASRTSAFISNRIHSVELMAGEQLFKNLLTRPDTRTQQASKATLKRYCNALSASICYVMNKQGFVIADNRPSENTLIGNNYEFRSYFQHAIHGEPSLLLALGVSTKKRGLYFSHPIYTDGLISGVAIIKFLPDQIESSFQGLSGKALLVDNNGIIFAAREPGWLYKSLFPLSDAKRKEIIESRQFDDKVPVNILKQDIESGRVKDADNNEFIFEQVGVEGLPGWNIVYLLSPEHFLPIQSHKKNIILITLSAFFLIVLIVLAKLFFNLKDALKDTDDYRYRLEESKDRLQQFEEVTTEAIIIRDGLKILDINKRAEEMLQLARSELLNTDLPDYFSDSSSNQVKDKLLSPSEKPYKADIITRFGKELPVVINDRPIRWNGYQAYVTSLRDERRHQAVKQKLLASESRFRQLSDLVSEGIIIFEEHTIVDVNHALCSIIGERREDLIGTSLNEIFPKEIVNLFTLQNDTNDEQEVILPRRDGTDFPAEINLASMQFEDGLYSILSIRDITRQKEQEEHILYQAQYDLLTDIPNRFLARDRAEHAMANADHFGNKMVLMFIDLDGFKKVNDSLGHDVGDRLLQLATRRFQSCLENNNTIARHGGDEFIILVEDVTAPEDTELVLEKILQQFANPFIIDNKELIVTASIGVAVYPDDGRDYPSLLRAADIGMYKAKKDGRNTFHYYTQEMNAVAVRQLQLDNNLRHAMEREEFHLVYQPLVAGGQNLGSVVGAEALLRWDSTELGTVSPDEFIPLTENTGLIIPIGRWVLEQACTQAQKWIDEGFKEFTISVNVSPRQFHGNRFLNDLNYALGKSGLQPQHLNLEVTEGLLIQASPELNKTLKHLSKMGVKISMDDFGTGYSSLRYLQTFPFNNLKIDRAFIQNLPSHRDSKILVAAIIAMAHKLGLSVTAEGIEIVEQFNYMNILDCDILQGYFIGKPMDAEALSDLLYNGLNGQITVTH